MESSQHPPISLPPTFSYTHHAQTLSHTHPPPLQQASIETLLHHFHLLHPPPTNLIFSHLSHILSTAPVPANYVYLHSLLQVSQVSLPASFVPLLLQAPTKQLRDLLPYVTAVLSKCPLDVQTSFVKNVLRDLDVDEVVHEVVHVFLKYVAGARNKNAGCNAACALLPVVWKKKELHVHLKQLERIGGGGNMKGMLKALEEADPLVWNVAICSIMRRSDEQTVIQTTDKLVELFCKRDEKEAMKGIAQTLRLLHERGGYRPGGGLGQRLRQVVEKVIGGGLEEVKAFEAVCKIGLEEIEDMVFNVLRLCAEECKGELVMVLLEVYGKRRDLEGFFKNWSGVLSEYKRALTRSDVRRKLCESVYKLPRGHGVRCAQRLRGYVGLFVGCVLMECTQEAGEIWKILNLEEEHDIFNEEVESEEMKSACWYALGTRYLMELRGLKIEGREEEFVTAGGGILLGRGSEEVYRAARDMIREGLGLGRLFCALRLIAVLEGEVGAGVLKQEFEKLKDDDDGGGRLFHVGKPREMLLGVAVRYGGGMTSGLGLMEGWEVENVAEGVEWMIGRGCGGEGCKIERGFEMAGRLGIAEGDRERVREGVRKWVKRGGCCQGGRRGGGRFVIGLGGWVDVEGDDVLKMVIGGGGDFMRVVKKWERERLLRNVRVAMGEVEIPEGVWKVVREGVQEGKFTVEELGCLVALVDRVEEGVGEVIEAVLKRELWRGVQSVVEEDGGELLVQVCGKSRLYEGWVDRLIAQALYWVMKEKKVGVEMICRLGAMGGKSVVKVIVENVQQLLDDVVEGEELNERIKRVRGRILAGVLLLCGCEQGKEVELVLFEQGVKGFVDVMERRDLSGIVVGRDDGVNLVLSMLYVIKCMLYEVQEVLDGTMHLSASEKERVEQGLNSVFEVVNWVLQAVQVTVERRPPNKLRGEQWQELLIEVTSLVYAICKCSGRGKGCVERLVAICRGGVFHHGGGIGIERIVDAVVKVEGVNKEKVVAEVWGRDVESEVYKGK